MPRHGATQGAGLQGTLGSLLTLTQQGLASWCADFLDAESLATGSLQ